MSTPSSTTPLVGPSGTGSLDSSQPKTDKVAKEVCVIYAHHGLAKDRRLHDGQVVVGGESSYWFIHMGRTAMKIVVEQDKTTVSAATARERVDYFKLTTGIAKHKRTDIVYPETMQEIKKTCDTMAHSGGPWPYSNGRLPGPAGSDGKSTSDTSGGSGQTTTPILGKPKWKQMILSVLVILLAWRITSASGALVSGPCGVIDVTTPHNRNYKSLPGCEFFNCTSQVGTSGFRLNWLGPNTPTPNGPFGNLSMKEQGEWRNMIVGLGSVIDCDVIPPPEETWQEYFVKFADKTYWHAVGDDVIVAAQSYVRTPDWFMNAGWQIFYWLFDRGVFGYLCFMVQSALWLNGHDSALPFWKLVLGFPSVYAAKEGFMILTVAHYMTTFHGSVIGIYYACCILTDGFGYGMVLLTFVTAANIVFVLMVPPYVKQDTAVVPLPMTTVLGNIGAETAFSLGMMVAGLVIHAAPGAAVGVALMLLIASVFVLPSSAPEQVVMVTDGDNKRHRVVVYPKCAKRCGPFYNLQARNAGTRTTPAMLRNTYMLTDTGMQSNSFLYNSKLYLIKHGYAGAPCAYPHGEGVPVALDVKKAREIAMNADQALIEVPAPQTLNGKSAARGNMENGWHTMVSCNERGPACWTFYGTWNGTQLTGLTHNEPGMSGAPVYDSEGKLVAVHVGGKGDLAVMLRFPDPTPVPKADPIAPTPVVTVPIMVSNAIEEQCEQSLECMADTPKVLLEDIRRQFLTLAQQLADISCKLDAVESRVPEYLEQRKAFTEEEYDDLKSKGFDMKEIRAMAARRIAGEYSESSDSDSDSDGSVDAYYKQRIPVDLEWDSYCEQKRKLDRAEMKRHKQEYRKRQQKTVSFDEQNCLIAAINRLTQAFSTSGTMPQRGGDADGAVDSADEGTSGTAVLTPDPVVEVKTPTAAPRKVERKIKELTEFVPVCKKDECNLKCGGFHNMNQIHSNLRKNRPAMGHRTTNRLTEATYHQQCLTNVYDEQRTRGRPALMKCGAKTTTPPGHCKYASGPSGKACGCGPADFEYYECVGESDHSCVHYYCGRKYVQKGNVCSGNCRSDFCRLPKNGGQLETAA